MEQMVMAVLIVLGVYSIPISIFIHHYFSGAQAMELERLRQESISNRQLMRPKEWWQDLLVEVVKRPELLEKVKAILPGSLVETFLAQAMKR